MDIKALVIVSTFALGWAAFGCKQEVNGHAPSKTAPAQPAKTTTVKVNVTAAGYEPASVAAKAGEELKLVFTRSTDEGCGQKVVFPDHKIERDLPLNQAVTVSITPKAGESISFTCGMGMYKGSIVAKS